MVHESAFRVAAVLLSVLQPPAATPTSKPLEPDAAIRTIQLPSDLTIELVAAEPQVVDPVSVCWDEAGRMYVVEMSDYPIGPPAGRIKLLEDRDRDGRIDSSVLFADGLHYPSGAAPWRGGLIVTAAPNIYYLKDGDGDGRVDERRVLFTGFGEGNQQLRVNSPIWGLDNWLYGANGRSDGEVRRLVDGSPVGPATSIRLRDFRLRPSDGRFEPTAGYTQFGHGFDDWGRRFISWNTVHVRHVVLEQPYLERNPLLPSPAAALDISDHGSAARIFPASSTTQRFNAEPPGYINASCGLTVYRGDALPPQYRGGVFVCEPLSNLVHRDALSPAGATFVARRGEADREFLASSDQWFRPVNLATGPDGALYVCDFYRAWVEHPAFTSGRAPQVDFREGADRGRIYRIRARNPDRPVANSMALASPVELTRMLGDSNGWVRDTAQRLLVERNLREAAPALRDLVRTGTPLARVHALHTLDGLSELSDDVLRDGLAAPQAPVRENALRIAEARLRGSSLADVVRSLASDPDPRVRFQVACSLGVIEAPTELAEIALHDVDDEWTRRAALSAVGNEPVAFTRDCLMRLSRAHAESGAATLRLLRDASSLVGARNQATELADLVTAAADATDAGGNAWRVAVLAGLGDGQRRVGRSLLDGRAERDSAARVTADKLPALQHAAVSLAQAAGTPAEVRVVAIAALSQVAEPSAAAVLRELLEPRWGQTVQIAAIHAAGHHPDRNTAELLLGSWQQFTPEVRRTALDVLLTHRARAEHLIRAIGNGQIAGSELDATQRELLVRYVPTESRGAVERSLGARPAGNRSAAVTAFQPALVLTGIAERGAGVFQRHCVTCHAFRGQGQRVGPDLASVAGRDPAELLADILDPSRTVAPDAVSFVAATRDGRVIAGIVVAETATTITLRRAGGMEDTIARAELDEFRATRRSLMPDGLERGMVPQDLADLIAYLKRP